MGTMRNTNSTHAVDVPSTFPLISLPKEDYDVAFLGLRWTLDYLLVQYQGIHGSQHVWGRLLKKMRTKESIVIPLKPGKKQSANLVFDEFVYSTGKPLRLRDKRLGVKVDVLYPRPFKAPSHKFAAGVKVTFEGHGFQTRVRGKSFVRQVLKAVESLLFPKQGKTRKKRWEALDSHRFVRELHLAVDVAVRGSDATRWMEKVLIRSSLAKNRVAWVTKAKGESQMDEDDAPMRGRKPSRKLSHDKKKGHSFSIRGSSVWMTVYQKDREPKSWPRVAPVLERLGLLKDDRVARVEWKCTHKWLRDVHIGRTTVDKLTVVHFLRVLPSLAHTLWTRYRHATPAKGPRTRWKPSAFWRAAETAIPTLGSDVTGACSSRKVQNGDLSEQLARSMGVIERETWKHLAYGGPGHSPLSVDQVTRKLTTFAAAITDEDAAARIDALRQRVGLPPAPTPPPARRRRKHRRA